MQSYYNEILGLEFSCLEDFSFSFTRTRSQKQTAGAR